MIWGVFAKSRLHLAVVLTLAAVSWAAPAERVLHQFMGASDGNYPIYQPLIFDSAGNLYGTTVYGGANNCGIVFELSPGQDGNWTENILYTFVNAPDGCEPWAGLTFDSAGNLYGTTQGGGYAEGYAGGGTVYRLAPNQNGGWDESVIYTFGNLAVDPESSGVVIDGNGNLYGSTVFGGIYGFGTVYELTPQGGGTWGASVLYSFTGKRDGGEPLGGVTFDISGNIYAATYAYGEYGAGTIFKLTKQGSGTWTGSLLHAFTGLSDGGRPNGPLTLDMLGNVYGTTQYGRGVNQEGEVFRLAPDGQRWKFAVIHGFAGGGFTGTSPNGGLVFDSEGNLYGTTQNGPEAAEQCSNSRRELIRRFSNRSRLCTAMVISQTRASCSTHPAMYME